MRIVKKGKSTAAAKASKPKQRNKVGRFFVSLLKNIGLVFVFLVVLALVSNFASPDKLTSSEPFSQIYTIIESEGGTYLGAATDLAYSGIGEFQYIDGGIYEGSFVDSLRDGEGVFTWENGDRFEGTWSADGMLEGTFTFANGISYTGTFSNDSFDRGYFDSETTFASGGTYIGSIEGSKRGGEGTFVWENGDSFSGIWEDDKMADGTYSFADGRSYTGSFKNNKFDTGVFSLGSLTTEKGFESFEALFTSGNLTGFNFKTTDGLSYNGDISGDASITYKSGNTYVGEVKNGVRHGDGEFKWKSNSSVTASYDGDWVEGVMSGSGSYYYSASSYPYITGTFVNGKPDGTATYYKESGNTFTTTWANGTCSKVVES